MLLKSSKKSPFPFVRATESHKINKIDKMEQQQQETRVIYFVEDNSNKEKSDKVVPYMVKLNVAPGQACLRDFKKVLNNVRPNVKYFFQNHDADIG